MLYLLFCNIIALMHSYCVQHCAVGLCAELPGTRAKLPGLNFHKATDALSLISQSHQGVCRSLRLYHTSMLHFI